MKTVIEMAREAGFVVCRDESVLREMLERFAELVRADERAQRKPLTDDEIGRMYASCKYGSVLELAKAIEAAHGIKEKNT